MRKAIVFVFSVLSTFAYADSIKLMPDISDSMKPYCDRMSKEFDAEMYKVDELVGDLNAAMKVYLELIRNEASRNIKDEQDYKVKSIAKSLFERALPQSDRLDDLRSKVCISSSTHYDWSKYYRHVAESAMRQLR